MVAITPPLFSRHPRESLFPVVHFSRLPDWLFLARRRQAEIRQRGGAHEKAQNQVRGHLDTFRPCRLAANLSDIVRNQDLATVGIVHGDSAGSAESPPQVSRGVDWWSAQLSSISTDHTNWECHRCATQVRPRKRRRATEIANAYGCRQCGGNLSAKALIVAGSRTAAADRQH